MLLRFYFIFFFFFLLLFSLKHSHKMCKIGTGGRFIYAYTYSHYGDFPQLHCIENFSRNSLIVQQFTSSTVSCVYRRCEIQFFFIFPFYLILHIIKYKIKFTTIFHMCLIWMQYIRMEFMSCIVERFHVKKRIMKNFHQEFVNKEVKF